MRVLPRLAVCTCLLAVNASASTISLTPVDDNSIFAEATSNSNGAGVYIFAGQAGQGTSYLARRALMKFDVSGTVPAGSVITGATLTLHVSNVAPGGNQPFTLHRLLAGWGEGTSDAGSPGGRGVLASANDVTWLRRFHGQPSSAWTAPGADFIGTVSASRVVEGVGTFPAWSSPQLVADVQGWLDTPSTQFGWLLKGNEAVEYTAKRFDSKEHGTPANRPHLDITYLVPGETGSLFLSAPPNAIGGESFNVTVTARDAIGSTATGYRGTIHFSSSDSAATLPGDYTFTAADNGVHTFAITLFTAGSKSITVSDTVMSSLTSEASVIVRGNTTTTLMSSANPSNVGNSVTFTATVTSAAVGSISGTVTFKDGSTTLGTGELGSSATFTTSSLSSGSHPITAVYEGDANFNSSTSDVLTQVVNGVIAAPAGFSATATSTSSVALNWLPVSEATSYEVHRTTSISTPFQPLPATTNTGTTDTDVSPGTTYIYKVRTFGSGGPSSFSGVDVATTVVYIDSTLAGVTIKAEDAHRLRTAVNAMRAAGDQLPAPLTDASLVGAPVKRIHLVELREALDDACDAIGLPRVSFTDPSITGGVTPVKGAHWMELRAATQ